MISCTISVDCKLYTSPRLTGDHPQCRAKKVVWERESRSDRNKLQHCQIGLPHWPGRLESWLEPGLQHAQWGDSRQSGGGNHRNKPMIIDRQLKQFDYLMERRVDCIIWLLCNCWRAWGLQFHLSMLFPGLKCPDPSSVANGKITPAMDEYLYSDYIFVRCDQGYKLMAVKLLFFYICHCMIENKNVGLTLQWLLPLSIAGWCGDWEFLYCVS